MGIENAKELKDTSDGRFYSRGAQVFRSSRKTQTGSGARYTLGFPVCSADAALGEGGAEILVAILNEALEKGIITDES